MIFEIPLFYIAFKPNTEVERHYLDYGFKYVHHYPAVRGDDLSIQKLSENGLISFRVREDLFMGRTAHSGMPTKGGIGCSLSHYELWMLCIKRNYPYIIICEDDGRLTGEITPDKEKMIMDAVNKDNGVFISSKERKPHNKIDQFFGTHFTVFSQSACKVAADYFFPIDVQLDSYIGQLRSLGKINVTLDPSISRQKFRTSSIQTYDLFVFVSPWKVIILLIVLCMFLCLILYFKTTQR